MKIIHILLIALLALALHMAWTGIVGPAIAHRRLGQSGGDGWPSVPIAETRTTIRNSPDVPEQSHIYIARTPQDKSAAIKELGAAT